jgi:aspartokinase
MTRTGPAREAQPGEWRGRLENAKAFHKAARELLVLHEEGQNGNPVIVMIVCAAIAYTDALTAAVDGRVNQKDHSALPRLLRDALGQKADAAQIKRLERILEEKDAASYGARTSRGVHARELMEQLERFSRWVTDQLA